MKICVTTPAGVLHATLDDNPSARDLWRLLPLTLTLKDYAQAEKIAVLARRLSTERAPDGMAPAVGDIAYYAPWGNLALFYREAVHAQGLVRLGRLEGDLQLLTQSLAFRATIERATSAAACPR